MTPSKSRYNVCVHEYMEFVNGSDMKQWVAFYCPDKFDLFNNTSNAVEQENARLKRIGARSMTLRHVSTGSAYLDLARCQLH